MEFSSGKGVVRGRRGGGSSWDLPCDWQADLHARGDNHVDDVRNALHDVCNLSQFLHENSRDLADAGEDLQAVAEADQPVPG